MFFSHTHKSRIVTYISIINSLSSVFLLHTFQIIFHFSYSQFLITRTKLSLLPHPEGFKVSISCCKSDRYPVICLWLVDLAIYNRSIPMPHFSAYNKHATPQSKPVNCCLLLIALTANSPQVGPLLIVGLFFKNFKKLDETHWEQNVDRSYRSYKHKKINKID